MPRPVVQSRKPAKLSQPLRQELSVYVLVAGAAGAGLFAASQPPRHKLFTLLPTRNLITTA
jgi:hypothetical protein